MGTLLLITALSIYSISFINLIERSLIIISRGENAICLKYQIQSKKKYLYRMNKLNKKIRIAYLATLVPKTRLIAKVTHQSLKKAQSTLTAVFEKKSFLNKYCKKSKLYFKNKNPYQHGLKLKRRVDGTAIYKKNRGFIKVTSQINTKETQIVLINNNKRGKWDFQINTENIKGVFSL